MSRFSERQRQIIDVALDMIQEGGLPALTMRGLSDRLGVSEPALYRHFENKTAILLGMLDVLEEETYGHLSLQEPGTPEVLDAYFDRLFKLFSDRPALATVVFLDEFAVEDPVLLNRVKELLGKNRARLTAVLSGMRMRGTPDSPIDAESCATLLMGGIRLMVREWRFEGDSWDLVQHGRRLVAALTASLKGRKE